MKATVSLRLLTTTIAALEITLSTLENYHYSLSVSERTVLKKFATSLAANTVNELDGLITTLQSLDCQAASEVERLTAQIGNVVLDAAEYYLPGERERLTWLLSKWGQPPISPVTYLKNIAAKQDTETDKNLS